MSDKNLTINITSGTIIKTLAILLIGLFLYLIKDILMAVLFSVVIASGVEPAAIWFKKKRVPRVFSVIFVYLAAFAFISAIFYLIIPTIFREVTNFAANLPSYLENPLQFEFLAQVFPNLPDFVTGTIGQFISKISDLVASISSGVLSLISAAFGGAISLILIIVLSFYLSVQENGIEKFLGIVTPSRHEKYAIGLWMRWRKKIGLWLQGQILLGFIVGVLVYIGLTILQVEYALTFALLAALFELLPIFGPILAAVPPVMMALTQSPLLAGEVAILFIIIQQFENLLIYPLVVTKIVGVPPIIVILALIIGAQIGGFFGLLLAIPLAIVVIEVLGDIDVRKKHSIKEASEVIE